MRRWSAILGLVAGCAGAPAGDGGGSGETGAASGGGASTGAPTSGAGETGASDGSEGSGASDDSSSSGGEVVGSAGCGSGAPGRLVGQGLVVDGVARTYDLFVPSGYVAEEPAALVLNFHGNLSTPAEQAAFSGFDASAEAHGMLVAYPAGLGNSFNGGACCGDAYAENVDDVGFARALVAEVERTHCVDPRRVFVAGMSNGGHMAHRLACEAADVFAAAASVTGVLQLAPEDCAPARPISVLDFHGTGDVIVPYAGKGSGYPAVPDMMRGWAARDECDEASVVTFDQVDMVCETWPGCADGVEVTLCTVADGGHCWPGPGVCPFGHNSQARDASAVIAAMFAAQPLAW